jgi:glyoxylase-like metal-dependent hydrolase (beta-lactamase superfamily II)
MVDYAHGRHEVADGVHAWLQPDGGWGLSNAGYVARDGAGLLVDTLFDLRLTREMLDGLRPFTDRAPIGTVVNTHANGDHCYGNSLLPGARVVASDAAAREMDEVPPAVLAGLQALAREPGDDPVFSGWVDRAFGSYDFDGIELAPPTDTFTGTLSLPVGSGRVDLIEVGPAHTAGDVIAHVPDAGVVFTGDILFHGGTPVMWAGPIDNWIAACDRVADLDPAVVVPGHGPVTDVAGVGHTRDYLTFVRDEVTARRDAGMGYLEAAHDIDIGAYADLEAPGRIVVTAHAIYRTLDPAQPTTDIVTLLAQMAHYEAGRVGD